MSYCRFENTVNNLLDCVDALEDRSGSPTEAFEELSSSEKQKAKEMREVCERYIALMDDIENDLRYIALMDDIANDLNEETE